MTADQGFELHPGAASDISSMDELRQVWRQAMEDETPGVPANEVLDRLERKYQDLARQSNNAR